MRNDNTKQVAAATEPALIRVKFLGHIKTSMSADEMDIPLGSMTVSELFCYLLDKAPSESGHGFSKFNTLVVVNDEEVFSASSQEGRKIADGDTVLLVPFSHGG